MRTLALTLLVATAAFADPERGFKVNADMPAGTVLQPTDVDEVDLPEKQATSSMVKADAFEAVREQPLRLPLLKGDLLRYSFFSSAKDDTVKKRCQTATNYPMTAPQQVATHRRAVLQKK